MKNTNLPDKIDLLAMLFLMFGLLLLSESFFAAWAGKAKYLLSELLLFSGVLTYMLIRRFNIPTLMRIKPLAKQTTLRLIVLAGSSAVLFDELDRIVAIIIPIPPDQAAQIKDAFSFTSSIDGLLVLLGVGLAGPIIEELLFRGVGQSTLERSSTPTRAVLIGSLVFASIHLQPWWFIQLLILSVLVGYLTWLSGSIIPAVLIHAANNLWTLVMLNEMVIKIEGFYFWNGHVNPLLLIICLLLFKRSYSYIDKTYRRI